MTATWPAISGIQYDTVTIGPIDQRTQYQSSAGHTLFGSLATTAQHEVRFDVVLTGSELSTFQGWFEASLKLGALDFDGLEGVVGDNAARYKFRDLPTWTVIRHGPTQQRLWRSSFVLWKL
jgi:hypothetical protein